MIIESALLKGVISASSILIRLKKNKTFEFITLLALPCHYHSLAGVEIKPTTRSIAVGHPSVSPTL